MIAKDFELVKEIFTLIESGIVNGYDYFCYEIKVGEGYMEAELIVENAGVRAANVQADFNGAILYDLVKRLKHSAKERGEDWTSFAISYRRGEKVVTNFKYLGAGE